ncbi:MAG: glucosidase [Candidatus Hydrogenedentes bacterium]|nr:glucosidase [Candidatus Hydrogenedentota bacterium]
MTSGQNEERARLAASDDVRAPWRLWGPYLSERQWGTVREDYSPGGDAWDYFPHAHARSRAYRWGEDGIAGLCDDRQLLCFGLALWNGRDPFLKERLFGLSNGEGNHGEDVKELYYYLDATPTHSYLKMLYKYPQAAFPYEALVEKNQESGVEGPEYELIDTGLFDADRYFDVFVEFAKASPTDICIRITAHNRGPDAAPLHLLPQICFRNTWSWQHNGERPAMRAASLDSIQASHPRLSEYMLYFDGAPTLLFTENETNTPLLYNVAQAGHFKDAFHDCVVQGRASAVNSERTGTKAAGHYSTQVPGGGAVVVHARLCRGTLAAPFTDFDQIVAKRIEEADAFYAEIQGELDDPDLRQIQRQAFAGMIWSKQFYRYNVWEWLKGDKAQPPPPQARKTGRNADWAHLNNADIISMPDKWEYPWYAAWDLAFHCIPLAIVDAAFAKHQLVLMTREWYMHPNAQLPAYEWAFEDVNPPVHAWATWRVFQIDRKQRGDAGDLAFLERVFHKLMLNFTWWVNKKDADGNNVFQGGFLGLDNIGLFDRSSKLPTGGSLSQSDGTSWMAMYCLNLMRIALELARHNPVYQDIASKFFEHFLYIAQAMTNMGGKGLGLWDETDEFFYDVLHRPDGTCEPMKVRSMVGLIPLFAVETLEPELLDEVPEFAQRLQWFLEYRPDLASLVSRWSEHGRGERHLLSLLRGHRMKMLLKRMLDPGEFLSGFGVRALSKVHEATPYSLEIGGVTYTVQYQPAESDSYLFGGNSNWRGPIWFPVNFLIIESLQKFHHYYGNDFKIEHPTGSGNYMTIDEVATDLGQRLTRLFTRDAQGLRPLHGASMKQQLDPHFTNYLLFHEYFHGDTGRGAGASHQTGWTGLVAKLILPRHEHG